MILILDNYDSFTYNLYQLFLKLNYQIKVVRSDKITVNEIEKLNPTHIVISPGPGTPEEAGISIEVVKKLKGKYPILGVCLGHQAILASFGVPIVSASRIVHGKVEKIVHNGKGVFRNVAQECYATRYHSLAGKEKDIPDCFVISAKCEDGEVMAVEHKEHCLVGLQFHPESIGTKDGELLIKNFLHYKRESVPVKSYLDRLVKLNNLSFKEAQDIMDELTDGNMHESQIGSLLTSLQIKGFTAEELAGFASVLRKKASMFPRLEKDEKRLDTCGTGGSKEAKTFNVSTTVALLAAASGAKVVKHGNRAATSSSGSADLLEKLGVNIEMSPDKSYEVYKKSGFTFLYARKFHSAMRFAAPARTNLGFRTIFNLIGPLSNPANANYQLLGVYSPDLTELVASALSLLGVKKALVVHGMDGLDEISISTVTKVTELNDGWIKSYMFNPEDIGIKLIDHNELKGGDSEINKKITLDILSGIYSSKASLVYLNCGAALYLYGIADSIKEGYGIAREIAKSGKGIDLLEKIVSLSSEES